MSDPKASPKLKSVENFKRAESALLFVLWVVVAVLERAFAPLPEAS